MRLLPVCFASFPSRAITSRKPERDCLTDPSPGPPASARQISSTCSPKLYAAIFIYYFGRDPQTARVACDYFDTAGSAPFRIAQRITEASFKNEIAQKRYRAAPHAHFPTGAGKSQISF